MEWNSGRTLREGVNPRLSRILSTTSGNAQSTLPQSSQHNGNYDSFSTNGHCQPQSHNVIYKPSVPSNDRRALLRQKLNVRRIKRRARLAEKYLQHPKFLAFKARPRKDVDKKSQEVIWNEETEAAFQNAIINIPAMGRKKKSQHGKTFGRNELIREWIKQETGKTRDRKQVSSHMQTLDKMFEPKLEEGFEGIPEWRMLNRGTDDSISDYDEPDFYENSIADMVRNWRVLQASFCHQDNSIPNYRYQHQQSVKPEPVATNSIASLDFAMWVSHPDRLKKALHQYTRIQSNQTIAKPEPLENIHEWRNVWPALATMLDNGSENGELDIILLEASLELMLDFPPPGSKLASSLELEFTYADSEGALTDPSPWQCTTRIYQSGQLLLEIKHNECHSPGLGRIKPPFESKWWAEQFTRLTEQRRRAIDSGSGAAIALSDEAVKDYLSNLAVIQHIERSSIVGTSVDDNPMTHTSGMKQGAVLLWTFSQVTSRFVGTTTWRRLIPPPPRARVNSPMPSTNEFSLPALDLDTNVDTAFVSNDFEPDPSFLTHGFQNTGNDYMPASDEELCQDGFMVAAQQNNYSTFNIPIENLGYAAHNHITFQSNTLNSLDGQNMESGVHDQGDLFHDCAENSSNTERHQNHEQPENSTDELQQYNPLLCNYSIDDTQCRSNALLSFDVNTSRMLQARLEDHMNSDHRRHSLSEPPLQPRNVEADHYAEKPFLLHEGSTTQRGSAARFALSAGLSYDPATYLATDGCRSVGEKDQMLRSGPRAEQAQEEVNKTYSHRHDWNHSIVAPRATRPTLQHHHTFAGVVPTVQSPYGIANTSSNAEDTTTRHDFALLIDNLYGVQDELFDHNSNLHFAPPGYRPNLIDDENGIGLGIIRPHSQPPPAALYPGFPILMSNEVDIDATGGDHLRMEEEELANDDFLEDGVMIMNAKDQQIPTEGAADAGTGGRSDADVGKENLDELSYVKVEHV